MSDHLPESFPLASILAEQGVHHQKELSQNDWLKTTHHHKLIPSPQNPRLPHGRAVLLGSLILLLSTQVPFPNKISCFVSTCDSLTIHFLVLDESPVWGPGRGFPSYNIVIYKQFCTFMLLQRKASILRIFTGRLWKQLQKFHIKMMAT